MFTWWVQWGYEPRVLEFYNENHPILKTDEFCVNISVVINPNDWKGRIYSMKVDAIPPKFEQIIAGTTYGKTVEEKILNRISK